MSSDNPSIHESEMLPFEIGYLPDFYAKKAKLELNDTPEARENGLKEMRKLMANDKLLSQVHRDDRMILSFLRARKFNVQRAFKNLKSCINFRLKYSPYFSDIYFESLRKAADQDFFHVSPYRCPEGCAIMILQMGNWDPDDFSAEEFKRFGVLMFFHFVMDIMTQVTGYKVIFDLSTNSVKHLRQLTPGNVYFLYHGTQECIPGRLKSVHFVSKSPAFKIIWMILKQLMTQKFKERSFFHYDPKTLLDYFPKYALPENYGGTLKKFETVEYIRKAATPDNMEYLFSLQNPE